MSTILRQINTEIQNYKTKQIQIVPGLFYNQYSILQRIYFYYNSKFSKNTILGGTNNSGGLSMDPIDEDGDRMYFYNIVKNPCKVFSKAVDFTTKDIKILTAGGADPAKTWFFERDLKYWFKDINFGKILNRLFYELPIYGSVVLKNVDGKVYFVDLRNFIMNQSADTLNDSGHIIEMHNYSVPEFRKIGKQMKWKQEDIDRVVTEFHTMKDQSHIKLYERYGEVEEVKEDGTSNWVWKRTFLADVGLDQYDNVGNLSAQHPGIELASEKWEGHPYWEFHAEKAPGRWLGVGVVETLFEPQIRTNEIANVQSKTTYWAGLRIFQTKDPAINRNLYTDAKNGEILNVDSDIIQVDMADRNLAFFGEESNKWMQNRSELTFAYGVVQGQAQGGIRGGNSMQMLINQTLKYFEQIQENIALDLKEMLYEVVLPQFEKENTVEHTLRLVGEDLDVYISMVKNDLVLKEIIRQVSMGKPFPSNDDRDMIEALVALEIKNEKEKLLTIPKSFYKDLKYDIDISIMGEGVDTKQRYATSIALLQAITADPTVLTDPTKKKILAHIAEDGGINPEDLFGADPAKTIQDLSNVKVPQGSTGPGAGGGVSAPAQGGGMNVASTTKTL